MRVKYIRQMLRAKWVPLVSSVTNRCEVDARSLPTNPIIRISVDECPVQDSVFAGVRDGRAQIGIWKHMMVIDFAFDLRSQNCAPVPKIARSVREEECHNAAIQRLLLRTNVGEFHATDIELIDCDRFVPALDPSYELHEIGSHLRRRTLFVCLCKHAAPEPTVDLRSGGTFRKSAFLRMTVRERATKWNQYGFVWQPFFRNYAAIFPEAFDRFFKRISY
jgi:hypothetical protein